MSKLISFNPSKISQFTLYATAAAVLSACGGDNTAATPLAPTPIPKPASTA